MTRWARGEMPWIVSWDMAAGRWHVAGQRQILHIRMTVETGRGPLPLEEPMYSFDTKAWGWFLPDDLYGTEADAAVEVEVRQIQTFGRPRALKQATRTEPASQQGNFLIRKMEDSRT